MAVCVLKGDCTKLHLITSQQVRGGKRRSCKGSANLMSENATGGGRVDR